VNPLQPSIRSAGQSFFGLLCCCSNSGCSIGLLWFPSLSFVTNCQVPWPTFGFQIYVGTAYSQKRKQIDLKLKDLYWVIGRKSPASLESKVLPYKTIIKHIRTYGIELWGCASKSTYIQNATKPVQNTADDHKCALVSD
jgi:hypothetical protein